VARLPSRTIVIAGGASGIGAACARRLAAEGASVVIADIDGKAGRAVADDIGQPARFAALDVRDESAWRKLLDETVGGGGLHGLVNAAGVAHRDDTVDGCSRAIWDHVMAVNLDGVFLGTKHAVLRMKQGGGVIVNIASVLANVGEPTAVAYCASKGGVWLLTKAAALHCAQRRYPVRVNSVHPGYIRTPLLDPYLAAPGFEEAVRKLHPLGRLGRPEEVADLVLYLMSDDSGFVNGSALSVDGGYLAQ
jgi:NAD(P)-dependent dehydrogenase (short-subunit alcohol dehydrogenase family)